MPGLIAAIFFGLVVASIIIFAQDFYRSSTEARKNKKRIYTWWIIFGVCLPVCLYGGWLTYLFIYGLFSLAVFELIKLSSLTKLRISCFVTSLLIFSLGSFSGASGKYFYSFAFLLFLFGWVVKLRPSFTFVLVVVYVGVCLQSLISVLQFCHSHSLDAGIILFSLLFISAINDIAQYIAGRKFGRHSLAPGISPNKTIEGAAGGLVVTTLVCALLLPDTLNTTWITAAAIGVLLSTLGILGDLYISRFKRGLGVKDTGKLLPGHGGVLDRIDSLLLMAPGFGWMLIYLLG